MSVFHWKQTCRLVAHFISIAVVVPTSIVGGTDESARRPIEIVRPKLGFAQK